jgi:hypothetical protein
MPSIPLDISIVLAIVSTEANEEATTMASIPGQDLQREVLAFTRKSQDAAYHAIKAWIETVRTVSTKVTSAYEPLTERAAKLRTINVPFADKLPTPEEALADAYRLGERLLDTQRRFAEDLLKAMVPLMQGGAKPSAPEPEDTTAPDPTASAPAPAAAPETETAPNSTDAS